MFNFTLILMILGISISEVVGQSSLQYYHKETSEYQYFLIAVLCYAMVCYLLLQSYNYKGMGIVNTLWSGTSIIVILFVGIFFFNEKIYIGDIIGIILILIGFFLISYNNGYEHYNNMSL